MPFGVAGRPAGPSGGRRASKNKPRIIEVAGPAGSGKSTLARALAEHGGITLVDRVPTYRRIRELPFYIINILLLTPLLFRLYRSKQGGWFTREQVAELAVARGWHRILLQQAAASQADVVVDEGPLYCMAYLHVYGPEVLRSQAAQPWWESIYTKWAHTLDMVIWLDTCNMALVDRIRTRPKWHGVKLKSDPEAHRYLDSLRGAYEQLLPALQSRSGDLRVLRFDTGKEPVSQICERVIAALDDKDGGN